MESPQLGLYPYLLPHITIGEEGLFIGVNYLGECTSGDRAFLLACDGQKSIRELQSRFTSSLESEAARAALKFLTWLEEPLESVRRVGDEKVLVLSPYPHVGFLSLAGYLINRKGGLNCTYVSCFSRVNATIMPEGFPLEQDVSAIRRDEAAICARIMGGCIEFWDYPAHDVRSEGDHVPAAEAASLRQISEKEMHHLLRMRVYRQIDKVRPQHVFGPAGLGSADHRILFEVLLDVFKQGWFPDIHFHCYEEYPFGSDYINVDDFLSSCENSYVLPRNQAGDVVDAWRARCMLLDVYRSLYSDAEREEIRRVAARNGDGWTLPERYWTLTEWC
jgi:hypothetical protein